MQLKKEERETLVSLGMLIVSVALFISVFFIRNRGDMFGSPRLVPFIVTGIMILLSLVSLIRNALIAIPSPKVVWSSFVDVCKDKTWQRIFISVIAVTIYILIGIRFLGYYISSAVMIFLCTLLLVKKMKWWKAIIITIGMIAILYLLFSVLLGLPLK